MRKRSSRHPLWEGPPQLGARTQRRDLELNGRAHRLPRSAGVRTARRSTSADQNRPHCGMLGSRENGASASRRAGASARQHTSTRGNAYNTPTAVIIRGRRFAHGGNWDTSDVGYEAFAAPRQRYTRSATPREGQDAPRFVDRTLWQGAAMAGWRGVIRARTACICRTRTRGGSRRRSADEIPPPSRTSQPRERLIRE